MKVKEIIKIIEADGWIFERQKGSHKHFSHALKKGLVTIPGKPSDEINPKTLNSIYKQAGLK